MTARSFFKPRRRQVVLVLLYIEGAYHQHTYSILVIPTTLRFPLNYLRLPALFYFYDFLSQNLINLYCIIRNSAYYKASHSYQCAFSPPYFATITLNALLSYCRLLAENNLLLAACVLLSISTTRAETIVSSMRDTCVGISGIYMRARKQFKRIVTVGVVEDYCNLQNQCLFICCKLPTILLIDATCCTMTYIFVNARYCALRHVHIEYHEKIINILALQYRVQFYNCCFTKIHILRVVLRSVTSRILYTGQCTVFSGPESETRLSCVVMRGHAQSCVVMRFHAWCCIVMRCHA